MPPLHEIISPHFLSRFSDFASLKELMLQSGCYRFDPDGAMFCGDEAFFDRFIRDHTRFPSWLDMYTCAVNEYFTADIAVIE